LSDNPSVAAEQREAQAIFVVRSLLLLVTVFVITSLAIGGIAKLVAPSYDAGHIALVGGWLGGVVLTLVLLHFWQRRRR
jgi:hypothetical protein